MTRHSNPAERSLSPSAGECRTTSTKPVARVLAQVETGVLEPLEPGQVGDDDADELGRRASLVAGAGSTRQQSEDRRYGERPSHLRTIATQLRGRGVAAHAVDEQPEEAVGQLLVSRPGWSHVYAQFAAERKSSPAAASSRSERSSPCSRPSRKSVADPFLVAPPLGDERFAPLIGEVPPLAREDGRDVELLGDDAEVGSRSRAGSARRRARRSGTASSAAWNAAAPLEAISQRRSCFESMCA